MALDDDASVLVDDSLFDDELPESELVELSEELDFFARWSFL
ncbi:MAG: hypothetical protein R8J94_01200 [Acidimicrobiia bacterium]|nr:hypothetical protein [Acidimicrobiia bacterium]